MNAKSRGVFSKLPLAWQEDAPWEHSARVEYFEALGYFVFSVQRAARIIVPRYEATPEVRRALAEDREYFWLDCVIEIDLDELAAVFRASFIPPDFRECYRELQHAIDQRSGHASFHPLEAGLTFDLAYEQGKAVLKARARSLQSLHYSLSFELECTEYDLRQMVRDLHQILHYYQHLR